MFNMKKETCDFPYCGPLCKRDCPPVPIESVVTISKREIKMKLSTHFGLEEMTKSQTGIRKGIDNTPGPEVVANLVELCVNVLEKVREHWGSPVTVNSGYRCPKLNKAIGGASKSQHLTGQAADIEVPGIDNLVIFEWIRYNLEYDQLILEYYKPGIPSSGWVHVSWKSSGNRKNVLIIK